MIPHADLPHLYLYFTPPISIVYLTYIYIYNPIITKVALTEFNHYWSSIADTIG